MTPFPTVWSQLATCATTGNPRRRAAARNGTALAGWTFESRRPEHSRRIAPSSRAGTCRCALKNHRSIARSTGGQCGSGPSRSVSSIQLGCPGSIRSPWNPCRWLRRIARGWYPMRRSSQASTRPSARSGRPSGETRSSPCRTGSSGSLPAHSAADSCGTRNTAASLPSRRSCRPRRIPVSTKTRMESRSGRTTQGRFALIEPRTSRLWRLVRRRARRSAPRATRRPARGSRAPRRASHTRASRRRRRP